MGHNMLLQLSNCLAQKSPLCGKDTEQCLFSKQRISSGPLNKYFENLNKIHPDRPNGNVLKYSVFHDGDTIFYSMYCFIRSSDISSFKGVMT